MKATIRLKFNLGIVFLFIIISLLSFFSAYYLTRMSNKVGAILKENHYSVVFARDMSENLTIINQEVTNSYLSGKSPDSKLIDKETGLFEKSLALEKNNITETGEDKLAAGIESDYRQYCDTLSKFIKSPKELSTGIYLQKKFGDLYQQLVTLSKMNEKAIEVKTSDAKISANNALKQMTILATLCFIITLSFTYAFASYFNARFFQLYHGIKEIVASNYGQRLHFDGSDEFHEISVLFNKMAENLSEINNEPEPYVAKETVKADWSTDIQEMKEVIGRLKNIEKQALELISKLEKK
jgi:methyl-accepting chemotaxis protein